MAERDDAGAGARPRLLMIVIGLVGLVIATSGYLGLVSETANRVRSTFEIAAGERVSALHHALQVQIESLQLVRGFVEARPDLSSDAFEHAVSGTVARDPALRALEWVPRIEHPHRARYEAQAGRTITERGADGALRPAATRAAYYPVTFVEPRAHNEAAIGYDLASERRRRAAIGAAIGTGDIAGSAPIHLVQSGTNAASILLVGAVRDATLRVRGVVVAVVEVAELMSWLGAASDVELHGRDLEAGDAGHLYGTAVDQAGALSVTRDITVAGRPWRLALAPSDPWLARHRATRLWLFPALVLLTTLIAVFVVRNARDHARNLEEEARFRRMAEAEVRELNRTLEERVARRTAEAREGRAALIRTQRRLLEQAQQLRQAQKMEAFGQLAGGVAHDFNNMLVAIIGTAELALADLGPQASPALREDLVEIGRVGQRAAELTRQLMAFSRQQVLDPRVVDIGAVLGDVASLATRVLDASIGIEVDVDDALRVLIDPAQLEQVLVNLVLNARDAMPDGGLLHLGARAEDDDCLIRIRDTGTGMTPEVLARVFEPFFTTKPVGEGTGLGLSTCQGIITQSGGRIDVRSTPGAGTEFTLVLPRIEGEPEAPTSPAPDGPIEGGTETILLVDDERPVRTLAVRTLAAVGYEVMAAESAEEALRLADGPVFDLLVTDLTLPGINGVGLATQLRVERPDLPVLLMSGHALREVSNADMNLPFLQKPFVPVGLLRAVRRTLDAA